MKDDTKFFTNLQLQIQLKKDFAAEYSKNPNIVMNDFYGTFTSLALNARLDSIRNRVCSFATLLTQDF